MLMTSSIPSMTYGYINSRMNASIRVLGYFCELQLKYGPEQ